MPEPTLAEKVWARQSEWSQTAGTIKDSIDRWRGILLGLAVAGAASGTAGAAVMSSSAGLGRTLVVVSTICVGLLPVFRPKVTGQVLVDWTNARAVSEAFKTEMFLYRAGAGSYAGPDPEGTLLESTTTAAKIARGQVDHRIGIEAEVRPLPEVTDPASYFEVRLKGEKAGQIPYFTRTAAKYKKYLGRFKTVEIVVTVVGVVLGSLAAFFTEYGLSEWVAVATTIAAAVAARSVAGQYEFQMLEYLSTRTELEQILETAGRTSDPAELKKLVERSEQVLSAQNRGWMAQLATDPTAEPAPGAIPAQPAGPDSDAESRTTG